MRVLAFDTATAATAVALVDDADDMSLEARDDPAPGARPGHTRRLLALVEDVLGRSGSGWEGVDRIAVGVGPGTFTGLRIGVATAHALARAREIPLVGVSTLASLALGARAREAAAHGRIVAAIDARRGEVFASAWEAGADPLLAPPELAPAALAPAALAGRFDIGMAVGDGAIRYREILASGGLEIPPDDSELHLVSARWHCQLAALNPEPARSPNLVQPAYLRRPDAERSLRA